MESLGGCGFGELPFPVFKCLHAFLIFLSNWLLLMNINRSFARLFVWGVVHLVSAQVALGMPTSALDPGAGDASLGADTSVGITPLELEPDPLQAPREAGQEAEAPRCISRQCLHE
jgi:hypothetical protein